MKYILQYALFSIALVLATPVVADAFDDGFKAFSDGDFATALRIWRPLADQGDAMAQFFLGRMYAEGQGVKKDYKRSQ